MNIGFERPPPSPGGHRSGMQATRYEAGGPGSRRPSIQGLMDEELALAVLAEIRKYKSEIFPRTMPHTKREEKAKMAKVAEEAAVKAKAAEEAAAAATSVTAKATAAAAAKKAEEEAGAAKKAAEEAAAAEKASVSRWRRWLIDLPFIGPKLFDVPEVLLAAPPSYPGTRS